MTRLEEAQLIRRCQSGDSAAYEQLFSLYARRLTQTAYLITGSRFAAEDVLQEAFVQTFRAITRMKEPGAFSTWLYRITVRAAQRYLRRERMVRQTEARVASEGQASAAAPEHTILLRETVWEAIAWLPEHHRIVVVLYYFEDRPVAEIAAILEVPEGTVKSWLHRARTTLGNALGPGVASLGGGE